LAIEQNAVELSISAKWNIIHLIELQNNAANMDALFFGYNRFKTTANECTTAIKVQNCKNTNSMRNPPKIP